MYLNPDSQHEPAPLPGRERRLVIQAGEESLPVKLICLSLFPPISPLNFRL